MSPGWVERSQEYPDGQVARWRERPAPGKPGVVERHYTEPVERLGPVVGTARVTYEKQGSATVSGAPAVHARRKRPAGPPVRRVTGVPVEIEVLVKPTARETIMRDVTWKARSDGRECGGWLAGISGRNCLEVPGIGTVMVTEATGTSERSVREPSRVRVDMDQLSWWSLRELWGSKERHVGLWHVHPSGDPTPSPADFTAWERGLADIDPLPYYVGLIVAPRRSWSDLCLYAWATRKDDDGRLVTEPCRASWL